MNEIDSHENFKRKKDYGKWDNFIKQINSIDLSSEDKGRAKLALEYLRDLLGENFLSEILQHGHPLFSNYLLNSAPRPRLLLIRFAESLKALENAGNFTKLVIRLRKASKFAEGLTVLDTAIKFQQAGFNVDFDEKVNFIDTKGKSRSRVPDIKLTDKETAEEIFVEVSRSRASQTQIEISHTYDIIWRVIRDSMRSDRELTDPAKPQYIRPYARIHRAMSDNELQDIVNRINQLIQRVRENGEFEELVIKDLIEVGVSPVHDHSKAKERASLRGLTDLVESPLIQPDEISRMKSRMAAS